MHAEAVMRKGAKVATSSKPSTLGFWVRGHLAACKDRFRQEHYLPRILNLDWKDYHSVSSIVKTGGGTGSGNQQIPGHWHECLSGVSRN